MIGRRVRTVEALAKLAEQRRAVWYQNFGRPIPAVVILNMSAGQVLQMIRHGLYLYKKS